MSEINKIGEGKIIDCKEDPITNVWIPKNNLTTPQTVQSALKAREANTQNALDAKKLGKKIDVKK